MSEIDTPTDGSAQPRPVQPVADLALASLAERTSLREEAADRLRAALVAGQMRAGVIYSVPALAAQFGVSATPVREAMLDLVNDGLVEAIRNRGFRVTEPTDRELDEITQLRAMIEVPTVANLARSVDPEAIEALRPQAALIVSSAEAGDLIGYVGADRSFHLELLQLGGNARLVRLVDELRARTRLYGLEALFAQGKLTTSAREHDQILDALLARDAAAVEEVMARHIGHIRGIWAARPEGAPPDGQARAG